MSEEIWVEIENYPNYQISNMGRVYSLYSNKYLKPYNYRKYPAHYWEGSCGYWGINLSNNNKKKTHYLHQLVANHFIPNPHNYPCVLHREDNRWDNSVDNLYWGNHSTNSMERWDRDRKTFTFITDRGETITTSNLTLWCEENNIPRDRVTSSIRRNRPVNTTPGRLGRGGNPRILGSY